MVRFIKFLAYTLFFIMSVLIFLPKENLYFLLEKELAKQDIFISNETISTGLFSIELEDAVVTYEGIEVAKIIRSDFELFLLYDKVELKEIELSSLISNYWPSKIENVVVTYSVIDPVNIHAVAEGTFGQIVAEYSLEDSRVSVVLKPSKLIFKKYRSTLRYFKKSKDGEYTYEKSL